MWPTLCKINGVLQNVHVKTHIQILNLFHLKNDTTRNGASKPLQCRCTRFNYCSSTILTLSMSKSNYLLCIAKILIKGPNQQLYYKWCLPSKSQYFVLNLPLHYTYIFSVRVMYIQCHSKLIHAICSMNANYKIETLMCQLCIVLAHFGLGMPFLLA